MNTLVMNVSPMVRMLRDIGLLPSPVLPVAPTQPELIREDIQRAVQVNLFVEGDRDMERDARMWGTCYSQPVQLPWWNASSLYARAFR